MPRLCILTQYFPPEMGAPQARLSELGERLLDLGWQVEVLTALPNYPHGKVFDGYAPLRPVTETIGRLKVARVPIYASRRGFAKRIASYFSFVGSATALGPSMLARPDLLYVESPPLFIGYAARALALRWRCPYVFNVSDLWPESAIRMGVVKAGLATEQAARLEKSLYRHAAGVTGQSQEILDGVIMRAPRTPVALVTNGVDPARFGRRIADDAARALVGSEPGPVYIYAGLFGHAQGLDQILDLAASLPPETPGRFVLVGDGPVREELEARVAQGNLGRRVKLVPSQPRERIPALLAAADAAIITLGMPIPGAVPSKIYEAMASELAILLVAEGEAARRVEEAGAGVAVSPGDKDGLRKAFLSLAAKPRREAMGRSGRHAAETLYDRSAIARRLDTFLRERINAPVARDTAAATPAYPAARTTSRA